MSVQKLGPSAAGYLLSPIHFKYKNITDLDQNSFLRFLLSALAIHRIT